MSQQETFDEQLDDFDLFRHDGGEAESSAGEDLEYEDFDEDDGAPEHADAEASTGEFAHDAYEAPEPHAGGGTLLLVFGIALAVLGAGLGGWRAASPDAYPAVLDTIGLTPFSALVGGLLLLGLTTLRRNQSAMSNQTDAQFYPLQQSLEYVMTKLETPDDGLRQDVQHAIASNARLDEKISNLSRATKMYGKPLLEVAAKVETAANHIEELENALKGVLEKVESSSEKLTGSVQHVVERVEASSEALTGNLQHVVEKVESSSQQLTNDLTKLREAIPAQDTISVADFERLAETASLSAERIDTVLKQIDAAADPATAMDALKIAFESSIAGLGDKVTAISEALKTLEQTTKTIQTQAAAAPAPAPARTAAPAAAPATQAAPAPSAPAAPTGTPGPGALAQSIAGERKAGGKNVLGAIAKLKSMRP